MELVYSGLITLVLALFFGMGLVIVSRHIHIPAIVLLLLGGILIGPEVLRLINPRVLGPGLRLIIQLSVALVLFDGGLTLNPKGFKSAPRIIWNLLTLGVLISWLGTSLAVYLLFKFDFALSLLAGSLIIVTGPTVIAPLLRRVKIKEKLHHILHWEGVLIDPIGVFIAILCFEWYSTEGSFWVHLLQLSLRIIVGVILGIIGGKFISLSLKLNFIPEHEINIFVFSVALLLFGLSDFFVHESGILTVVVAGLIVGLTESPALKNVRVFKSELTTMAIALLFVLLAASLQLDEFVRFGWKGLVLIGIVIFIIRPVSIFICTYKRAINVREKLFLSWIAPRGVVAGSMASLFGLELVALGYSEATFLEAFTFSIIGATILLQGLSARFVAKLLNVHEKEKKGWLIVGAHALSHIIAHFISTTTDSECILLDSNHEAIQESKKEGFIAFQGNALSTEFIPHQHLANIGNVLALTDNRDLNQLICEKWATFVDKRRLFRWSSQTEEFERESGGLGHPIWSELGKPSKLAYDVSNNVVLAQILHINESLPSQFGCSPILMTVKNKVYFTLENRDQLEGSVLWLQRLVRHLPSFIEPENIVFYKEMEYENLLSSLTQIAMDRYPQLRDENITEKIIKREKQYPNILSNGVVVPHLHSQVIKAPVCFVAMLERGLDLNAHDQSLGQLFFLFLSPANDPELHLMILAEIAKVASDPLLVKNLTQSKDGTIFIKLLQEMFSK